MNILSNTLRAFWPTTPKAGEWWIDDTNPFQKNWAEVLEVRRGWVHFMWWTTNTSAHSEDLPIREFNFWFRPTTSEDSLPK